MCYANDSWYLDQRQWLFYANFHTHNFLFLSFYELGAGNSNVRRRKAVFLITQFYRKTLIGKRCEPMGGVGRNRERNQIAAKRFI